MAPVTPTVEGALVVPAPTLDLTVPAEALLRQLPGGAKTHLRNTMELMPYGANFDH